MRKKLSTNGWKRSWLLLLSCLLLGIGSSRAADLVLDTPFTPGTGTYVWTATGTGYLTVTFDTPVNISAASAYVISPLFWTAPQGWADDAVASAACNGTPNGVGEYYGVQFNLYNNLTIASWPVTAGQKYCLENTSAALPQCTATFSTELPDIGGGGDTGGNTGGGDSAGQYIGGGALSNWGSIQVNITENGWVKVVFDSPIDMTGGNGVFFSTWRNTPGSEDEAISADETNGTPTGTTETITSYGSYAGYTNVTVALYQVTAGTNYTVTNMSQSTWPNCTVTFYTEKPSLSADGGNTGGGDVGGDDDGGEVMLAPYVPAAFSETPFTAPSDGYVMVEFASPITMKDAFAILYTYLTYADETVASVACNGSYIGEGNHMSYGGPYPMYANLTKIVFPVTGGNKYCVYNSTNSPLPQCSVKFYTEQPSLGGDVTPDLPKVYVVTDVNSDPSNPLEFELNGADYTFSIEGITQFRISTTKSSSADDWTGFTEGEYAMLGGSGTFTAQNVEGTGRAVIFWNDENGWTTLPWKGDYNFTVPSSIGTAETVQIKVLTDTPNPGTGGGGKLELVEVTSPLSVIEEGFSGVALMWQGQGTGVTAGENLDQITITNATAGAPDLTVGNGLKTQFISLMAGGLMIDFTESEYTKAVYSEDAEGDIYYMKNPNPQPVRVTVTIPAGALLLNDQPNEEIVLQYDVPSDNPQLPEAVLVAPEDGNEMVSQAIVMWGSESNWITAGSLTATVKRPDGTVDEYSAPNVKLTEEWPNDQKTYDPLDPDNFTNALQIRNFNQDMENMTLGYKEPGKYTLTIPAGSVKVWGLENEEVSFTFIVGNVTEAEEPTINPAEGAYAHFSGPVTITWEGYEVAATEDFTGSIKVLVDGEEASENEWLVNFVDADGNVIYSDEPDPAPAAGIQISLPWTYAETSWTYNVQVPAGMYTLTSSEGTFTNEAINLEYTGVNINDEVTCDPAKGSQLKSLQSFTLEWDEYVATLNPDCTEQITYGYGEGTATIAANGDGKFTITLDKEVTAQGWVSVEFPEGMFILPVDNVEVPSPALSIMYQISQYVIVPGNYSYIDEPLDAVTVYSDNIAFVGNVADIMVYDSDDEVFTTGASYEAVTSDVYGDGIKITFAQTFDQAGVARVVIPAGTFTFDGAAWEDEIEANIVVELPVEVPEPTISPKNGETVEELAKVTIDWEMSPLYVNWMWEESGEPFTLAFTAVDATEAVVTEINDLVEVVSETEETDWGWEMTLSSQIVITFATPYTEEGKYEITVPANYVELENYNYTANEEFTITYYIGEASSVSKLVEAVDGQWTVYNTAGVLVVKTDDAAVLGNLSKGLYIINGKKVLVK